MVIITNITVSSYDNKYGLLFVTFEFTLNVCSHESVFAHLRQVETNNNDVETIGHITAFKFNKTLDWYASQTPKVQEELRKKAASLRKTINNNKRKNKDDFEVPVF